MLPAADFPSAGRYKCNPEGIHHISLPLNDSRKASPAWQIFFSQKSHPHSLRNGYWYQKSPARSHFCIYKALCHIPQSPSGGKAPLVFQAELAKYWRIIFRNVFFFFVPRKPFFDPWPAVCSVPASPLRQGDKLSFFNSCKVCPF